MRNLSRGHLSGGEYQRYGDPHFSPSFMPSSGNLRLVMSSSLSDEMRSPSFKHWSPTCSSPNMRGPTSPLATRTTREEFSPDTTVTSELNEADFPPLHNREGPPRVRRSAKPLALSWVQREPLPEEAESADTASASPSSSLSVQPSTPSPTNDADKATSHSSEGVTHENDDLAQGQVITVPPTPEFTTSSITPVTPKTGHSFPLTPQSGMSGSGTSRSPDAYLMTPRRVGRFASGPMDEAENQREVDPTSLFVGNLEINGVNPWTEERLRGMFEKYGEVEDVKLYEPGELHFAAARLFCVLICVFTSCQRISMSLLHSLSTRTQRVVPGPSPLRYAYIREWWKSYLTRFISASTGL